MSYPEPSQSDRVAQLDLWAGQATERAAAQDAAAADPTRTDNDREVAAAYAERLRGEAASERAIAAAHRAGSAR